MKRHMMLEEFIENGILVYLKNFLMKKKFFIKNKSMYV